MRGDEQLKNGVVELGVKVFTVNDDSPRPAIPQSNRACPSCGGSRKSYSLPIHSGVVKLLRCDVCDVNVKQR